jgi:hypothetical protein
VITAANPPSLRSFNADGIPQVLRAQKRWAPWRAVWNAKRQKYDKVPHRADAPNYGISTAKPEQWATFELALAACQANPKLFAGIGYVMTGPHGVIGTDLDNCVERGVVAPWAAEVVEQLASYTEISPSGNGLRILSFGDLPADWNNHETGIEIYGGNEARFLTVTGEHLAGTPGDVQPADVAVLQQLEARYAKERRRAEVIDLNIPDLVDDVLLPSLANLDLPYSARDFLDTGAHRGDRSRELFSTAVALYAAGLQDDEVFSILAQNEHAMEIALDHRRQDHDRAQLYLWREHCCKGKARATPRLTADEFDDVSESPVGRDLSPVKRARFQVQSAEEFSHRVPQRWIIKGVLPGAGLCVLYGDSGSGKTFFALDLVGAVARGVEWRGKRVRQGRVVIICAEGAGGFRDRMEAYAQHHGVDLADFPVGVIADSPNLLEKGDVKDLLLALATFGKADIIVVDTLAQSMPGGNENAGEDMGRVLAHCKAIHRATGALVMLVHHSGKDAARGARGWSGLRGAADVQIEIVRAGDDRAAVIDKQKDGGGEGDEYGFKLTQVTIGVDEDGDDTTSCVLQHVQAVPKSERKAEPKGSNEKLVLKVLEGLSDLVSGPVAANDLIEAVVNQMLLDPDAKKDRRRELAHKAISTLQDKNRIALESGAVRLV